MEMVLRAVAVPWAGPSLGMESDIRASKLLKHSKTAK